ncbi:MAG: aminotransferase class V-fold PLP-dependent enzyme [Lachnospiraceae bacterium]|nr:aminotransferase class V-fold PLP-dependent enzyme [Lachnospiraceae bacterium]
MELLEKLTQLRQNDPYPMHMPGHKRVKLSFPDVYDIDITEIKGFDNLHEPEGIIKNLSDEVAEMYGADEAYLSVGGSTDMILTAIFASAGPDQKILVARNCHKSVYHAAILRNADAVYAFPEIKEFGIPGEITKEQIQKILEKEDGIRACVITSPTYEGVISDVRGIAGVCHAHGVSLIVDAAHGAHLGFSGFPENPIQQQADAVIVSLHKTLPSLTQTACLLRNRDSLISDEQIRKYFNFFETSSPSYVLMAGIDRCVTFLREEGSERFTSYKKKLLQLRSDLKKINGLTLFESDSYDESKIVIHMAGKSGSELAEILRAGGIEPEMASLYYVICMTSVMDTQEGFDRLSDVLRNAAGDMSDTAEDESQGLYDIVPEKKDNIGIAELSQVDNMSVEQAAGLECGGIITVYPPGIPLIVPGEVYTSQIIERIQTADSRGLEVEGLSAGQVPVINKKRAYE